MKDLTYFKKELLKVLSNQEKEDKAELKKALGNYESIFSVGYELVIEKGKAANIGETREWKGKKFRKIAPGKWRRIYESEGRGAKQSVKIIAKKIKNAQSTDELLELVMHNVSRFQDANGQLLPIVKELQDAVKEAKGRLNAGKPTAQQKIDEFNKKNSVLSEEERKTLRTTGDKAKKKEILTSKSDDDLKEIWKESINSKDPFFEKLVYNEIQRRNKEKEEPKTEPEQTPKTEKPKQKKEPVKKEKKSTGKLKIPEGIGLPTKDSDGISYTNIENLNDDEIRYVYLVNNDLNGSELAIDPTLWNDTLFALGQTISSAKISGRYDKYDEYYKEKVSDFNKISKLKSDFNNLPKAEKVKLLKKNIETLKANKAKVAPYLTEAKPNIDKWVIRSIERVFDDKIKAMESAITRTKKGQILENTIKTDGIVDGEGKYVRCWFSADGDGNIRISAKDYDRLPKTLQTDTDFIQNDSDSYTDYFDKDRMTITPSNPYYNEAVKAAFKQEYKKDIAAYKKATENNKKLVKNGGELQEEEKKEIEPLTEQARKDLEFGFKNADEWIKQLKPGYYNNYFYPNSLHGKAFSNMTDEQKREVYSYATKKLAGIKTVYGKITKDSGLTQEQLDKFLDEKLGEDFGKTKKEEETKESKTAKISMAAVTTLKKLKSDFIDFEKKSGIDRNLVESLFNGKEGKESSKPKKETKQETKQEEWVSPNPKFENNLSMFDDDELKDLSKKETDEIKLKIINHVMQQRGIKKSFSDSIYSILMKIRR